MSEQPEQPAAAPLEGNELQRITELLEPAAQAPQQPEAQAPEAEKEQERADPPQSALMDAGPASETEEPAKFETLNDMASALGVDMEAVYKMPIKGKGEEATTLGALKDAWRFDLDAVESLRQEQENTYIRQQRELELLREQIAPTPQQQQQAEREFQQILQSEAQKLFAAVPRLRDDAKYRAEQIDAVFGLAADYGYSKAEIENLADHRLYKLAMDAAAWRKHIRAADAQAKRVRGKSRKAQAPKQAQKKRGGNLDTLKQRAGSGLAEDQVAYIGALLGGSRNG